MDIGSGIDFSGIKTLSGLTLPTVLNEPEKTHWYPTVWRYWEVRYPGSRLEVCIGTWRVLHD